jgi:rRNA maturation protein Nop10
MPLNFPNTWGVKKGWSTPKEIQQPKKKNVVLSPDKKMKCPECGHWVEEFEVIQEVTEHGGVDYEGYMDFGDSSCNEFTIKCPSCGCEVFDSDPHQIAEYYSQE